MLQPDLSRLVVTPRMAQIKTNPVVRLTIRVGDTMFTKSFEWDTLPRVGEHIDFTFDYNTSPRCLVGGSVIHINHDVRFEGGVGTVDREVVCSVGRTLDLKRVGDLLLEQGFQRSW